MPEENWERRIIERLATEGLLEQQRARRWGIFFKLLTFAFLFITLFVVKAPSRAVPATPMPPARRSGP